MYIIIKLVHTGFTTAAAAAANGDEIFFLFQLIFFAFTRINYNNINVISARVSHVDVVYETEFKIAGLLLLLFTYCDE